MGFFVDNIILGDGITFGSLDIIDQLGRALGPHSHLHDRLGFPLWVFGLHR